MQERLERASRGSLMQLLDSALALRKSERTERNPISSRSHAICVIHFAGKAGAPARLTLVDLAGRHPAARLSTHSTHSAYKV